MYVHKYLLDTYLPEFPTQITKVVKMDESLAIFCSDTIFYPQGGGQPCDLGILVIDGNTHQVYHSETTEMGIAHLVKLDPSLLTSVGKPCIQRIDIERRLTNAKLHTAGHLLSNIIEMLDSNLVPSKGHHYPDASYIELIENEKTNDVLSVEIINDKIDEIVNKSSRYIQSLTLNLNEAQSIRPLLSQLIPQQTQCRMIVIDGFKPLPCGGTHIGKTSELKGLKVTRIKRKKDRIKVNYLIDGVNKWNL
ncbi:hydrolase [Vibrio gazogenes]|uniref:Hydrolase n=1 Tax=Vibrio gazogenes TaxID=687 RepID=A0A1Z2SF43_VIBGA|nr:hydrolase [Vibrio gazogenes]ASA55803.1 hydrolase [Vibrio gazogenes]